MVSPLVPHPQAILGGFLQAQAVALYEDIEQGLVKADTSNTSESDLISSLTYRDASNVESVYSDAAMYVKQTVHCIFW